MRIVTIVAAALLLYSCGAERRLPSVVGIEVVETEWPMESGWGAPAGDAGADGGPSAAGWPSGVTVRLTVDNPAGSVVLREGRLRVACGGGRAAVLVLGERVRIPDRGIWRVEVPLRVRIARNASALSLRSAIERCDAAAITVDWELAVRRGAWRGRVGDGPATLDRIFPTENMQRLWQVLGRVSGAVPAGGQDLDGTSGTE